MGTASSVDQQLADSFKKLVLKRPIEKITIKEITDLAGVIRPTFYNHFQDKYELLEWIIRRDIVDPILPLLSQGRSDQALLLAFAALQQDVDFYTRARKLEGQNSFVSIVQQCVSDAFGSCLKNVARHETMLHKISLEELVSYYSHSMVFVILRWIDTGMKKSPEEMMELYCYVRNHSFEDVLNEFQY